MVRHGQRYGSIKESDGKSKGSLGLGAMQTKPGISAQRPMHAKESAKRSGNMPHPALHIEASSVCSLDSTCVGSDEKGDLQPTSPTMHASLARQANFSTGSTLHHCGDCKPCAWYWKPNGCATEGECQYCHLCPPGELKKRKHAKVAMLRQQKALAIQQPECVDLLCRDGQELVDVGSIDAEQSINTNMGMTQTINSRTFHEQATPEIEQRITVKNTFIHVDFSDLPTASAMNDFLMSAGILFTASC